MSRPAPPDHAEARLKWPAQKRTRGGCCHRLEPITYDFRLGKTYIDLRRRKAGFETGSKRFWKTRQGLNGYLSAGHLG
jgi:hypothetical protein